MSSFPSVSVIIPAYNAAGHIEATLESVLCQTVPASEVLVVDDGSKDHTADLAERFPLPVRVLRKSNGGPASARNLGARESHGEWLAFLDADDAWLPEKLERQLPLCSDPKVGLIHSTPPAWGTPERLTFSDLWERNRIVNSTVLVRRQAFEAVGGLDEDRELIGVEDYNLWLRIAAGGWEVVRNEGEWVRYSPTEASLSRQFERFARAELANAEKIGALLDLPREERLAKRLYILDTYGRVLLHTRCSLGARKLFAAAAREAPSPQRLLWWAAAHLPGGILNARRAVASRTAGP